MQSALWPIELDCDAPPDAIVAACKHLHAPWDVRWCRLGDHVGPRRQTGWLGKLWRLIVPQLPSAHECVCAAPMPELRWYTVTFASGRKADYVFGQCPRCWTIFWEEV